MNRKLYRVLDEIKKTEEKIRGVAGTLEGIKGAGRTA